MTAGEAFGWLLLLAAAVAIGPELVSPRPIGLLIVAGVIFGCLGAALICDNRQPRTSEGHDGHA